MKQFVDNYICYKDKCQFDVTTGVLFYATGNMPQGKNNMSEY